MTLRHYGICAALPTWRYRLVTSAVHYPEGIYEYPFHRLSTVMEGQLTIISLLPYNVEQ